MKTKNILLGIFSLLTFATYSQSEKDKVTETKIIVKELKVKTENLDELKNFDWDKVNKMFESNEKDQEITLSFAFVNNSEIDNSKVRIDNFEFKVTGKTADIDNLIKSTKSSVEKFVKLNDKQRN